MKDRESFAFAGLGGHWTAREGVETFTILTTAADAVVASIPYWMPVIPAPEAFASGSRARRLHSGGIHRRS